MFLPWPEEKLGELIDEITHYLAELNIIRKDVSIRAPGPESYAHSYLTQLSNIITATIERFYLVICLLKHRSELNQIELESAAATVAAQLSVLYGINSPDFFEKSLFSSFIITLKNRNISMQSAAATLEPYLAIAIKPDIKHNILQVVGRNPTNWAAIYWR